MSSSQNTNNSPFADTRFPLYLKNSTIEITTGCTTANIINTKNGKTYTYMWSRILNTKFSRNEVIP